MGTSNHFEKRLAFSLSVEGWFFRAICTVWVTSPVQFTYYKCPIKDASAKDMKKWAYNQQRKSFTVMLMERKTLNARWM